MNKKIKLTSKSLKRIINIQWLFLIIYMIIKFLGGNYFEIVCENQGFINACNFIDNNLWCKIIVCTITSYIMFYFFYLAILQKLFFNKKQLIIFLIIIPVETIIKLFTNDLISIIIDNIMFFLIPLIFKIISKEKFTLKFILLYYLLGNGLNLLFQFISAFVRNLSITILDENTLISLILSFDVFIMLSLYYSYSNLLRIERKEMK